MQGRYTLGALRALVDGELIGDERVEIDGLAALDEAVAGQLTFAEHERLADGVRASAATGIVVPPGFPALEARNLIRVRDPRGAFARIAGLFVAAPPLGVVHPDSSIDPQAELGTDVSVGACAVVEAGARLGARTVVASGAVVARGVVVGEDCRIGPNAVLLRGVQLGDRVTVDAGAVLGGEGFGFLWRDGRHVRVPQIGTVVVGDDVEIGSNACIDRATLGATRIARGTKIDNLVQIGHNCRIGEHVMITGQTGISGSVEVGAGTVFGGQSAVVDHIEIGPRARIGACTLVMRHVDGGTAVWGVPNRPLAEAKREAAALARLPELRKQVARQQATIAELVARVAALEQDERGGAS